MKKQIILLALAGATRLPGQAQTIKVMTEQLTALTALERSTQTGYTLTTRGLNTLGDRHTGEYQQHNRYFTSLSTVNPIIYSPIKNQSYAKDPDKPGPLPPDSSRQTADDSRPH